jgi:AcrR family transcriptional regulator
LNPAAVHYHFGSKQILVRKILDRRIAPLNQERLLLLDHVLHNGEPRLESILDAYLRPVLRHSGAATGRLNSLLYDLPEDLRAELLDDLFGLLHRRFHAALRQALPGLSAGEVEERFRYSIAIMAHVASGEIDVYPSDAKPLPRRSNEDRLRSIVSFLAHGLRAPGSRAPAIQRTPE